MFMKNLKRLCTLNYTHIYFPYSTLTSACQGSGLATRFRHQNKPFYIGIGMKQIQ